MTVYRVLGLIFAIMYTVLASPVTLADDDFADILQNYPSKEGVIVKRRIFEDNTDRQLKQISLSSLVGDLEKNLFASALSFNKVLTDKEVTVPEIKVNDGSEHDVNKRQSFTKEEKNSEPTARITTITTTATTGSSAVLPLNDKVIFQTTEKVVQANGIPAHIVIDRIAIQPYTEGIAVIPIFELKHDRTNEDAKKNHDITKSKISKTEITSSVGAPADPSSGYSSINSYTSNSMPVAITTTTTTTEDALKAVTTTKSIEHLKEAEQELREKFAEIEAEPVILSARV